MPSPLPCASRHAGVAVLVSPDIPLQLGVDSRQQFCLQSLPSMERLPLQYTVCVARDVKAAHQEAVQQLSQHSRELPNMKALWLVRFLRFTLAEMRKGAVVTPVSQPVGCVCGSSEHREKLYGCLGSREFKNTSRFSSRFPPVCPAGCPSGSCSPMWIQGRRWRGS